MRQKNLKAKDTLRYHMVTNRAYQSSSWIVFGYYRVITVLAESQLVKIKNPESVLSIKSL